MTCRSGCSASRAWPRSPAKAASTARSASCSTRSRCRRRASPPRRSTPQLRQTNINAAGGRAEIAGSEQSVRVLGNARRRLSNCRRPRSSVPGGRTVRLADLAEVKDGYSEQRTIAKMNGRQVISFNVQRAKGASEVTVYDEAWAELHEDREGKSAGPLHRDLQRGRLHQGPVSLGDGRPWSKARSSRSSSCSCSCATCARP